MAAVEEEAERRAASEERITDTRTEAGGLEATDKVAVEAAEVEEVALWAGPGPTRLIRDLALPTRSSQMIHALFCRNVSTCACHMGMIWSCD